MSLVRPENINGLNESSPLFNDISQFIDFGQLKELVSNSDITSTNPVQDISLVGKCILADTGIVVSQDLSITNQCTIVFICAPTGQNNESGGDGERFRFFYRESNGDIVRLDKRRFSTGGGFDHEIRLRGSFGNEARTRFSVFPESGTSGGYNDLQCIAVTIDMQSVNAPRFFRNGSEVSASQSETTNNEFSSSTLAVPLFTEVGSNESYYVSGVVVFNRTLNSGELNNVTSDPWSLVSTSPAPSINLDSTPVYGEAISGSYANFGGTPTGPLQADDGTRQADISISVDSNNETFTGTFPALPAAGQSLPAGSLPYPGSIDVTLPDPGE